MRTILAALLLYPASSWASIPAVGESAWRAPLEAAVTAAKPARTDVSIVVDHALPDAATIKDPAHGIDVEVSGFGPLWVTGTVSGSLSERFPRRSWNGVDLMGKGVNVSVSPFGGTRFILSGLYTKADGKPGDLDVNIDAGFPPLRDLWISQNGLDLTARWQATGYVIEGTADAKVYDNQALAVIATAIGGLTYDLFRP